jgi:hypothetical protein
MSANDSGAWLTVSRSSDGRYFGGLTGTFLANQLVPLSPLNRPCTPCPTGSRPVNPGMTQAVREAVADYAAATDPTWQAKNFRIDRVTLAADDHQRGRLARYTCGEKVAARTLVVYTTRLDYARQHAVSASEGVYFVGRTRGRDYVWWEVH